MQQQRVFGFFVIIIILAGLSLPAESFAKPKAVSNGCTVDQIQSNFGNSCVDQMEQDIINNRSYTHALVCNGGEKLCCTTDNTTGRIINCRRPAGSRSMTLQSTAIAPSSIGGIQTRGVEGSDAADEEAPAPEWMTDQRLKQLQKDGQKK